MKKYVYLLFALALIVTVCSKRPNPCFAFTTTPGSKVVSFSNCSTEATSFTCDDGDAMFSFDTSPTHTYAANGIYTVKLRAVGDNDVFEETTNSVTVHHVHFQVFQSHNIGRLEALLLHANLPPSHRNA